MMMMALVMPGFRMSARYMRRFVKQAEVSGSLGCILLQTKDNKDVKWKTEEYINRDVL